MNKKLNKVNKKEMITVICILVIMVCIAAFFAISSEALRNNQFNYEQSLEETAVTVGDQKISLKEASYYIMVMESNYNEAANIYNADNLDSFWNVNINHKYIKTMAKEAIIDACIRDNVYYQQARKEGYELNEDSIKLVEEQALDEMGKLTADQMEITDYTKEDMIKVLTKIQYAKEYVSDLMDEGYTEEELDTGGSKYEEIENKYHPKSNDNVWDNITIGKVTINYER